MHFNYYFLKHLSRELETQLIGKALLECYSQDKDEIILGFTDEHHEFYIKGIFSSEINLLAFPNDLKRARKNSADLFKKLVGQSVVSIYQYKNERSFVVNFENHKLLFKLHGYRANLILLEKNIPIELFRNQITNDLQINLDHLDRNLDHSPERLEAENYDLKQVFPTFGKKILNVLTERGFEKVDKDQKINLLNDTISELNTAEFYLYNDNEFPYISLLKSSDSPIAVTTSAIEACNLLMREFFSNYKFSKEKQQIINDLNKELRRHNNYISKTQGKILDLENSTRHEEIANILMANLHVEAKNKPSINLHDFYNNKDISIKLKKHLSLQKNAEYYYRKSKNQSKELEKLNENITDKKRLVSDIEEQILNISDTNNFRELKKVFDYKAQLNTPKEKAFSPYLEFHIDNYQVLVGKNAKSNDILLKNHTSKNDLWLHARNVSGSHVLIKEVPGKQTPMTIIEKAAQLAAWYSKGKNDTLCPVIYTSCKFVRKPKGAAPGEVVVQQEEVILVKPCQKVQ